MSLIIEYADVKTSSRIIHRREFVNEEYCKSALPLTVA